MGRVEVFLNGALTVLEEAGKPLGPEAISRRIGDKGLWWHPGGPSSGYVKNELLRNIHGYGLQSPFQRVAEKEFALREWEMEEYAPDRELREFKPAPRVKRTWTDVAEQVLLEFSGGEPMPCRAIVGIAVGRGLLRFREGKRAMDERMYAVIRREIKQYNRREETPRFVAYGDRMVGLTERQPLGNRDTLDGLLDRLRRMSPDTLRTLIGQLLEAEGFTHVAVTPEGGDEGIDLRCTVADKGMLHLRMAVQIGDETQDVTHREVEQLRGSLGTQEVGLIATPGDVAPEAWEEAERSGAIPIQLLDGEELVRLSIHHGMTMIWQE